MVILGPIIAYFRLLKVVPESLSFFTYIKIFPKVLLTEVGWTYLGLMIFYFLFFIVFREKKIIEKTNEQKIEPPTNN
jgi:hypothetical protein